MSKLPPCTLVGLLAFDDGLAVSRFRFRPEPAGSFRRSSSEDVFYVGLFILFLSYVREFGMVNLRSLLYGVW